MSWRDTLRTNASFRGIPFYVESNETGLGRRSADHIYAKRDDGWSEDLGLNPDDFTVSAYIIGDDYIAQRDALIAAIKKPGAATLILPTQKPIQVVAKPARLRWESKDGGIEYLELTFRQQGANKYPSSVLDTNSSVSGAALKAKATAVANFNAGFQTNGFPQFVANNAANNANTFGNSLNYAINSKSGDPTALGLFQAYYRGYQLTSASLVRDSSGFSIQIGFLMAQISDVYPIAGYAYTAYKMLSLFGLDFTPVKGSTPSRKQEAKNQDLQGRIVRTEALSGMTTAASNMDFNSYDDAVKTRDEISDAINDEIIRAGDAGDDQSYLDLKTLNTEIVRDITTRAANLERIRTISFQRAKPALVASYELYETVDYADDIVARNKVSNPAFLPAGQDLQILI